MATNEKKPEQENIALSGSNSIDPGQAENRTDPQDNFQQVREAQYEQILPDHYNELRQDLANDDFLSDEEITTVMSEADLDRQAEEKEPLDEMYRHRLDAQQEQLSELEKSTGFQLNTEHINFMVSDDTLTDLAMIPEISEAKVTPVNEQELPKIEMQPSFLFTKDSTGEVKVVAQNQDTKEYRLNKTDVKTDTADHLPTVFLNKSILANFLENFSRAHSLTEGTLKNTGEKLSELIRGKVDLILVKSSLGYDQSLQIAKEHFSENNNINQKDPVNPNQPTKFQEDQVNWSSLDKIGISKERLQATGQLNKFLNGEKTSLIEPSSLKEGNKYPFGNTPFKLYLESGPKGVENKLIFKEPKLRVEDQYLGQKLSVEDKLSLITKGHLGRLMDINGKPHFVSVDHDLNILGHRDASTLKIPAKIKLANGSEIQLNNDQQLLLTQGKPVPLADLKDNKGQNYSGQLIVNASSGKLDLMREVPVTMTQTIAQNEDKKQVQANNEGIGKSRRAENGNPKISL